MKRLSTVCGLALALGLSGEATVARAQFVPQQVGPQQPALSPYLNLARPGNAGINYGGLVQPQINAAKQMQNLQQQQLGLFAQLGAAEGDLIGGPTGVTITGHPTMFFNYSHYFGQAGGNYGPMMPPPGVYGAYKK
jgi:hypothetical protein